MEKAIYIESVSRLRRPLDGYSRVYYGAEFCEWRMPGPAAVLKAYEKADALGLGFTLLTPWLTDRGIDKLARVLAKLADAGAKAEIAVNDPGALTLVHGDFPKMTPLAGRLLSRQKRCPRVPSAMETMPEAGSRIYTWTAFSDPVTASFLRGFGIRRAELDGPLQGVTADLKRVGLKGSVYAPYAIVTLTRHCPASYDGTTWQSFTGCRIKGCVKNVLSLSHPAHKDNPLVMRGNTQFVRVSDIPSGLEKMGIDRLVVTEDVP